MWYVVMRTWNVFIQREISTKMNNTIYCYNNIWQLDTLTIFFTGSMKSAGRWDSLIEARHWWWWRWRWRWWWWWWLWRWRWGLWMEFLGSGGRHLFLCRQMEPSPGGVGMAEGSNESQRKPQRQAWMRDVDIQNRQMSWLVIDRRGWEGACNDCGKIKYPDIDRWEIEGECGLPALTSALATLT